MNMTISRVCKNGMMGLGLALALACGMSAGGCQMDGTAPTQNVPYPVSLLLPKDIRIHPFTSVKVLDDVTKQQGLEVHIEARDAYGDATKAFGDFRFELYAFHAQSPDPKGLLLATWPGELLDPKANALHWSNVSRTYIFKLQLDRPMPPNSQYVLVTYFTSPYTTRMWDQKVLTAGQ